MPKRPTISYSDLYRNVTQAVLLGAHRRPLSNELKDQFTELGIDPENLEAEQLLEAISLSDRLSRTELASPEKSNVATKAPAESKDSNPLSLRATRALELTLGDTYRQVLPEFLNIMEAGRLLVPPALTVAFLETAFQHFRQHDLPAAERMLRLTGKRGFWLAAQHPEWEQLLPPKDFTTLYRKLVSPADKRSLLIRWRKKDPEAARLELSKHWDELTPKQQESLLIALMENLSPADVPFLSHALTPRRKGVRNLATCLLLIAREPSISNLLLELAGSWLVSQDGFYLKADPDHLPILKDHGLYDKKRGPEGSLVASLPPAFWSELTGRSPLDFISRLLTGSQRLLPALLESIVFYRDANYRQAMCRYLLQLNLPQSNLTQLTNDLYAQLTNEEYESLCEWGQKNVEQVYRPGSVLRHISLLLPHAWPDVFCKLLVQEINDRLNSRRVFYGFAPNPEWKKLPYRINVAHFRWLQQQLHAATERNDQLGALATRILQVVSFRKAAREAFTEKVKL